MTKLISQVSPQHKAILQVAAYFKEMKKTSGAITTKIFNIQSSIQETGFIISFIFQSVISLVRYIFLRFLLSSSDRRVLCRDSDTHPAVCQVTGRSGGHGGPASLWAVWLESTGPSSWGKEDSVTTKWYWQRGGEVVWLLSWRRVSSSRLSTNRVLKVNPGHTRNWAQSWRRINRTRRRYYFATNV